MGTEITLALNGIDIDWGKNRGWNSYHWLFPPGSLTDIEYRYSRHLVEIKPGFETTLGEARFRLCHLGYSLQETATNFDRAIARWNRTSHLQLQFSDFFRVLTDIDFVSLTSSDLKPFMWDFRRFVASKLTSEERDEAELEDFIFGMDFVLILRVLAERSESRGLALRWHHQDLVESGWAPLDDLTDISRQDFVINHTMLYGRLQDLAGLPLQKDFDNWLVRHGLGKATRYQKLKTNGAVTQEVTTLPTAVRNMIHHPENPYNSLPDQELRESVELLLGIAKQLRTPIPGLL